MDDFLSKRYNVVVVGEAHESSLYKYRLGVLARVVRLGEKMWKEGKESVWVCYLFNYSSPQISVTFTGD